LQYILLFTHDVFVLAVNNVSCFTEGEGRCFTEGEGRCFTEGEAFYYTYKSALAVYFWGQKLLRFIPPYRVIEEIKTNAQILVVCVHSVCAFVLSGSPIVLALSLAHV
jgi:hypothetical protein